MTGNGDPPPPPRRSIGTGGSDPCSISTSLNLTAVEPGNLAGLAVGRKLLINLRHRDKVPSVVCERPDTKKYIGAVAFAGVGAMIDCLQKGRRYEATLEKISGSAVQISIENID